MMEGTYPPADYLLEPATLELADYTARIRGGRIEVTFRDPQSPPDAERQAAIHREVEQVFQPRLILTGRPWEMTELRLKRHYPDGRADIWLTVASGACFVSGSPADFILRDAHGNVLKDTKAERLADERRFQEHCLRHQAGPLLQQLTASFGRAVTDLADLMTHLYEIRDALSRHFGGELAARGALGLTHAEWGDLGRIANGLPIQESRHCGNHSALRQATGEEKTLALAVARRMIRAYLDHLDRGSMMTSSPATA
jgi:hypothetical protein